MAQDINIGQLAETLNDKADIDLNNTNAFTTSNNGQAKLVNPPTLESDDNSIASTKYVTGHDDELITKNLLNYTTNRILEIPQDIKWRTDLIETDKKRYRLTILKDSVYYIPVGFESDGVTRKFSKRMTIANNTCVDGFWTDDTSYEEFVFFYFKDTAILSSSARVGANITSGDTAPTTFLENRALWYDTKNNYVKFTEDSGANWYNCSLPLLKGSPRNTTNETHPIAGWVNGPTQVFNGFGYIGSTAFALPGVKYQFADGLNENGTYKSIIKTFDNISLTSYAYKINDPNRQLLSINDQGVLIRTGKYFIQNRQPVSTDSLWYKPETNETFRSNGSGVYGKSKEIIIANDIATNSGFRITSFEPSIVPTINSYQHTELAEMSMPSDKYIDLTPGASGSTYTAPANGWFSAMNGNGKNGFCSLQNQAKKIGSSGPAAQSITDGMTFVPVSTGDTVILRYSDTFNSLNNGWFRFIYAKGEQ